MCHRKSPSITKLLSIICLLFFIGGCRGNGGVSSLGVGDIFDGTSSLAGSSGAGAGDIATIHNPEPTSIFLLGGGLGAAIGLLRKNKKRDRH